jgi:CHAT domain-containing protein
VPPEHDGVLTAQEVATLDLRGTALVVLSACDSGLGESWTGEGVLGLRRAFVQAGARNLVLTLWPIEDRSTTSLILEFYQFWQRTGDARRALAEVQRAWLKRLRAERGSAAAARVAGPLILSYQAGQE